MTRARWQWRRAEHLRHLIDEGNDAGQVADAAGQKRT
jgi:hypothetical protein